MGRLGKEAEDGAKQTRRRLDLDDDLDEVWAPRNPHLKHLKNVGDKKEKGGKMKVSNVGGNQSLRKRAESAKQDSGDSEFDTEAEIFRERDVERETQSVLQDIAKLSSKFESVALRDAYGRELRRRESIDSCFIHEDTGSASLGNSLNCSPLSTMSKIQLSNGSSASSRKSSNSTDVLPAGSRHSRSLSSASDPVSPGRGRRGRVRQLSAGSLMSSSTSTGARSPGMPRKVSSSANMLTTGLAAERRQHGSRAGSRGHSPHRA